MFMKARHLLERSRKAMPSASLWPGRVLEGWTQVNLIQLVILRLYRLIQVGLTSSVMEVVNRLEEGGQEL
jgi:hypothetical protein